jgi:hypothetical protein
MVGSNGQCAAEGNKRFRGPATLNQGKTIDRVKFRITRMLCDKGLELSDGLFRALLSDKRIGGTDGLGLILGGRLCRHRPGS